MEAAAEGHPTAKSADQKTVKMFDPDVYRAIVWILVALVAVTVWFAAPKGGDPTVGSAGMATAEFIKKSNDERTEGAPQQQVVNGWYVADALPVISEQIEGLHTTVNNNRLPLLALVFGLGFCADVVGRSFGSIRNRRVNEQLANSAS